MATAIWWLDLTGKLALFHLSIKVFLAKIFQVIDHFSIDQVSDPGGHARVLPNQLRHDRGSVA